jgi:hypothetical protein
MSRDIKYIGMDVHKEAIVIAVMKEIFKGAATRASCGRGPLHDFYTGNSGLIVGWALRHTTVRNIARPRTTATF